MLFDSHALPSPPVPSDPSEAARIRHTRQRRRMLDGAHRQDVVDRRLRLLGSVRSAAHGEVDLSANPFRVINRERAVLYTTPPDVRHNDGEVSGLLGPDGAIEAGGLWQIMSRFQAWCLGCREYLIRVHVADDGTPKFRPVAPDMVIATPSEDDPSRPIAIREWRLRRHPETNRPIWTVDVLDISDPDMPIYRVEEFRSDDRHPADLSELFLGGVFSGNAYPYRRKDGRAVLPFVLYHAENLGDRLWDCYEELELVEGSLNLAVLLSFFTHTMRDASWPQRYAVNAQVAGASVSGTGDNRRSEVIADPATVLLLEPIEEGLQPQIGQWSTSDPATMIGAIDSYAVRLAQDAGVPPSDLQRLGGTARSGYAIALSDAGKRAQQQRYRLQFKRSDEELIALVAQLLNSATGSNYPESGYSVVHRDIPLSPQELRERRAHLLEIAAAGLISKTRAYMELNPGISREQAERDLAIIAADRLININNR